MRDKLDKNMIYVTHDQIEAMTLGDRIVVMSEGVIQQQGTPEELFKSPNNRFVAGFIGSPAMNFIEGELTGEGDELTVVGPRFRLPINREHHSGLTKHQDRTITIGIRPSAFTPEVTNGASIELEIAVSEYLGDHSILVTRCGDIELLVEQQGSAPVPSGESKRFGVRPEDIMLFNSKTGERL